MPPIQLLKDLEPEVREAATLPTAGLVLDAHNYACYTEKTDGEANQLLMSLSPSVKRIEHA